MTVGGKDGIPVPALVAACVCSMVMAGVSARYSFFPIRAYYATRPVNTAANPHVEENQRWLREKAVEAQGQIGRLSPADRARMDALTHGHTEMVLTVYWQEAKR
jgi:hypothetical protein